MTHARGHRRTQDTLNTHTLECVVLQVLQVYTLPTLKTVCLVSTDYTPRQSPMDTTPRPRAQHDSRMLRSVAAHTAEGSRDTCTSETRARLAPATPARNQKYKKWSGLNELENFWDET